MKIKDWDKGFYAGIGICVRFLINGHGEATIAKDMMKEFGVTVEDFKRFGIADCDLEIIEEEIKNG